MYKYVKNLIFILLVMSSNTNVIYSSGFFSKMRNQYSKLTNFALKYGRDLIQRPKALRASSVLFSTPQKNDLLVTKETNKLDVPVFSSFLSSIGMKYFSPSIASESLAQVEPTYRLENSNKKQYEDKRNSSRRRLLLTAAGMGLGSLLLYEHQSLKHELASAVEDCDVESVERILEKINYSPLILNSFRYKIDDSQGNTILHKMAHDFASSHCRQHVHSMIINRIIKTLVLKGGLDINAINSEGKTALDFCNPFPVDYASSLYVDFIKYGATISDDDHMLSILRNKDKVDEEVFKAALASFFDKVKESEQVELVSGVETDFFIEHKHLIQEALDKAIFGQLPSVLESLAIDSNKIFIDNNTIDKNIKTQSEGYISIFPELKGEMDDVLVKKILQQEKRLSDKHYVVYHAASAEIGLFQDFMTMLASYFTQESFANVFDSYFQDFQAGSHEEHKRFRMPDKEISSLVNIKNFMEKNFIATDDWFSSPGLVIIHDIGLTSHRKQLLSVNLSLFGNHKNPGSYTWDYFKRNRSQLSSIDKLLDDILTVLKTSSKYKALLKALVALESQRTGVLYQIAIPKEKVNDVLYLSQVFGDVWNKRIYLKKYFGFIPYPGPLVDGYDNKLKAYTQISPLLDVLKNNPESLPEDVAENMQGRLLMRKDVVAGNSGIKMYRYSRSSPEQKAMQREQLRKIVYAIIMEWAGKNPNIARGMVKKGMEGFDEIFYQK